MHTAHDLLLNTVFYLMGICVLTRGAGKNLCGVWRGEDARTGSPAPYETAFQSPGVASLGAVMTFLSDNPAIISLASDKRFSSYFKKFQFILTYQFRYGVRHGTSRNGVHDRTGIFLAAARRLLRSVLRLRIVSTRLMQYFVLKNYPITLRRMWWRIRRRWKGGRRRMRNPDLSGYSIPA